MEQEGSEEQALAAWEGLSFKEFEAGLAVALMITPDKRSTFVSRIKQWRKMGFPALKPVGRGARTSYHLRHVLEVLVLTALLDAGVSPDRAITLLLAIGDALISEAYLCLRRLASDDQRELYAAFRLNAFEPYMDDPDRSALSAFETFEQEEFVRAMSAPFWESYVGLDLRNAELDERRRAPALNALYLYGHIHGAIVVNLSRLVSGLIFSIQSALTANPRHLGWINLEVRSWKRTFERTEAGRKPVAGAADRYAAGRDERVAQDAAGELVRGLGPCGRAVQKQIAAALMDLSEGELVNDVRSEA